MREKKFVKSMFAVLLACAVSFAAPVRAAAEADDAEVTGELQSESVTGISLSKTEITLRVGKSETLIASVIPENAADQGITWSSSDPSIAAVDQNGIVTAVADTGYGLPAAATITVSTDDGNYTAECTVYVEDPINAFVRRLYRLCFNRIGDRQGFTIWTNRLRSCQSTAASVVHSFFNSLEMKNRNLSNEELVERCYLVLMDRPSDAGGKKNWVDKLNCGVSIDYVLKGLVASREFTRICNDTGIERGSITLGVGRDLNIGITQFVVRCYTEVLGREFEVEGLNYWCEKIFYSDNKKQTAINVASNGFFHSREYLNKNTTNDEYVKTLYRTFLGREADKGGYNNWMKKLNSGTSRDTVLMGFANSKEFANIMAKYGIK